jgi:hypothetical protein
VREVSSQVLQEVARALQLAGRGAQITYFEDGDLAQVIDVGALARRGGTLAPSNGIFSFIIENDHGGAGVIETLRNPYNTASAVLGSGYTTPLPEGFDVWILALSAISTGTASVFTRAMVAIRTIDSDMGFGDVAAKAIDIPLMVYRTEDNSFAAGASALTFLRGDSTVRAWDYGPNVMPYRLRSRTNRLLWMTASTGTGTYELHGLVGVFPAGLGQDGQG